MSNRVSGNHVAVVPIASLDEPTQSALAFARTLSAEVLAVHVRPEAGDGSVDLERLWPVHVTDVPLVLVEGVAGSWKSAFLQAVRTLKTSRAAEQVTIILPVAEPRATRS